MASKVLWPSKYNLYLVSYLYTEVLEGPQLNLASLARRPHDLARLTELLWGHGCQGRSACDKFPLLPYPKIFNLYVFWRKLVGNRVITVWRIFSFIIIIPPLKIPRSRQLV